MRPKIGYLVLGLALAVAAAAQQSPKAPNNDDIYCSGMVTQEPVPHDTYMISGEQSNYKVTFGQGDLVYINKGSDQGAKVGDEFLVMRPVIDHLRFNWFEGQAGLLRAMGTQYLDLGRLRVVHTLPNVSIADVVFTCDYMQRGDYVLPFAERPVPPFKEEAKFDRFAPVSGRPTGNIVTTKNFGQLAGANSLVYINVGKGQTAKVGDYVRIYRYQGTRRPEMPYQTSDTAYKMYGFGSTPGRHAWDSLPREILGEGIVLRVSPNASTVLITVGLREIYVGDYAELE